MAPDRLYLNQGGFVFTDVTAQAGISHERTWNTGVTMVDINDDGWLDLYVGRSGNVASDRRGNACMSTTATSPSPNRPQPTA